MVIGSFSPFKIIDDLMFHITSYHIFFKTKKEIRSRKSKFNI